MVAFSLCLAGLVNAEGRVLVGDAAGSDIVQRRMLVDSSPPPSASPSPLSEWEFPGEVRGVCCTRQPGVPETGDYLTIESVTEDACIARCGDDPKCTGYEYHLRRSPRKCEIHWSAIDFALAADNVECKRKSTSPSRPPSAVCAFGEVQAGFKSSKSYEGWCPWWPCWGFQGCTERASGGNGEASSGEKPEEGHKGREQERRAGAGIAVGT